MNKLGDRLREVMQELGIATPKALAKYCGVSEGLVSQWFSGQTKLGPKPLRALGKTHFNLDWVANGDLPKYRKDAAQGQINTPSDPPDPEYDADAVANLVRVFLQTDNEGRSYILDAIDSAAERIPKGRGVRSRNKLKSGA